MVQQQTPHHQCLCDISPDPGAGAGGGAGAQPGRGRGHLVPGHPLHVLQQGARHQRHPRRAQTR